jgi:putative membrane protein
MMYWGHAMNGWGMLLVVFTGLILVGLLVAAVAVAIRQPGGRGILAARYARGEIGDEEYRRRLSNLGDGPPD